MTVRRLRRLHRLAPWLTGFALLGLPGPLAPAEAQRAVAVRGSAALPAPHDDDARYDPRATLLLKRMGESYARLGAFDLRIDIASALVPLNESADAKTNLDPTPFHVDETTLRRQGQMHMAFRGSNHLLIETEQKDPVTNKSYDLRWVSDGQNFWSYTGEKKIYTREKAPGNIHDFTRLKYLNGGTLELILLIGPNPFADLAQSVDSARRIGEADVRGVLTEVVSLQMEDPIEQSEMRLYIGKDDGLLHRMEIESIPIKMHDGPIKVGSKLDALLDSNKPPPIKDDLASLPGIADPQAPEPPKASKPVGSFMRFENDLDLRPDFPPNTFTFVPPKGSLMLGEQGTAVKHITPKQRLTQMAKEIRKQRDAIRRNAQKDE